MSSSRLVPVALKGGNGADVVAPDTSSLAVVDVIFAACVFPTAAPVVSDVATAISADPADEEPTEILKTFYL